MKYTQTTSLERLTETCYTNCMIILQANKIERSFAGDVLFENINLQVDERDRIALDIQMVSWLIENQKVIVFH